MVKKSSVILLGIVTAGVAAILLSTKGKAAAPPPCTPNWTGGAWGACQPGNVQYRTETDGCGNTRTASQYCTYIPPCAPGWICEMPLNGYKNDGCGNRAADSACNPPPPPPTGQYAANDGSTPIGTAVCIIYPSFDSPHPGIIQGGWQGYAYDVYDNIRGEILQMPYKYLVIGTDCVYTPPCSPTWACETPLNGYSSDGCGNRVVSAGCNPLAQYTLAGNYRGYNYYTQAGDAYLWLILDSGFNVGGFGTLSFLQGFVDNNLDYLISHSLPPAG